MGTLLFWLQHAVTAAFVLLGVLVAAGWLRRRDREGGFLVAAIVLLALVVGLGELKPIFGGPILSALTVVAFVGSGYAVFRFRHSFLPAPRRWLDLVTASAVLSALVLLLLAVATPPGTSTGLQAAVSLAAVAVWAVMVGEPIVRFWIAARRRPAVQRARLRALGGGLAGLVLVVMISAAAGSAAHAPLVQAGLLVLALTIVPLLYVGFAPPAWLRRAWRAGEEDALRAATQDLLTAPVGPEALAARALDWALRLVGAEAGCMVAAGGQVLAAQGIDAEHAPDLVGRGRWLPNTLVIPLAFSDGSGALALVSGPFTPVFGSDERIRVEQYADAVAPALERAALVEQLRQANIELQEASRHKSRFLANMSHELRTPLNAILGFSELLMDDDGSLAPSLRAGFLGNIHSSGRHLLGLINDILDLAKVEAGQTELYLDSVAVDRIAQEVLTLLEPLASRKEIEVTVSGQAGTAVADAGKVKQMLINLVSNAIKFTPRGGKVEITCRCTSDEVEIDVQDSGVGIPAADLARVFQEFEQVEPGPGHTVEGTGLGLALTRRFAELHGGRVDVRSEVGRGSTFTVHLPLEARRTAPSAPVPMTPPASSDGPLILVVEDNPEAAALLTTYLSRGGYRVEVASNGPLALDLARRLRPEAITLDVLLPEIDGWDVLAALKHDPETAGIPVVVVTVVDDPKRGRALGAVDYLVKPVDARTLLGALEHRHLNGRARGDETRILVVDDDPLFHEQLEGLLRSDNYSVVNAYGGVEGIRRARESKPAAVILDLLMPDVSGFHVVAALKSDPATAGIPILIVTAQDLSADDKRWLNAQAAAVLHKPSVAGVDLLSWLGDLVDGPVKVRPAEVVR